MPIQPNFLERAAFYTLNAAPAPMLDLAGALAFQTVSTAVRLNLFNELNTQPSTTQELVQSLNCQERGLQKLLNALAGLGYIKEKEGRYHNSAMTEKWFLDGAKLDLNAAIASWDAILRELWPHAPEIIRSGERPFDFYQFTAQDPALSHAHQQMMMMGNANTIGPDIIKKVNLPKGATRLLDVGGGMACSPSSFATLTPSCEPPL